MKKVIFLLILYCLSATVAFCQQKVYLSGKLKMKPGTTIRFSKYSDYISRDRERLSTVKTGTDSCFSVNFSLKSPEIVTISVNELGLEALLYPDLRYTFELASSLTDHTGNLLITLCNQAINPQIILKNTYNVFSDSTLSILFNRNNQRPNKKAVDLFNARIDVALAQTNDPFCKQLIQSLRVDYLTMSRAVSFASAFGNFIDCANLPMNNPAFQSLLASNFRMYFTSGPPAITRLNLFQGIPDSLHFSNLLQLMSVDPALKCIPVRETVLLSSLNSMIKSGELSAERAIHLYQEASDSASHPFNRLVATNLINSITGRQSDKAVPDFTLIFPDGSNHPLSSFKGKPLHLTFFTLKGAADRTLLSQLADVEHLADSLGVARFVCISTDTNRNAVKKYWAEKKYPMQLCFAPDDYEMIDFFNVYSYPGFVVLNSKGQINNQAPSFPGEQLLKQLISLHLSDNPKQPVTKDQPDAQHQKGARRLQDAPHRSNPPLQLPSRQPLKK